MSQLIFIDSFGHYTAAQMPTKWTGASGSIITSLATGSGSGFRGTAAKTVGNFLTLCNGRRDFVAGARDLCEFQNAISGVNITFHILSDGRIRAGVQGTFFKYSTFAITFGATYHFQIYCQFTVNSAVGNFYDGTYAFQVYVNGVSRLNDSISTTSNHYNGDTTLLPLPLLPTAHSPPTAPPPRRDLLLNNSLKRKVSLQSDAFSKLRLLGFACF